MNISFKEQHDDFYVFLEKDPNDCCCMWRKNSHQDGVYSIERLDVSAPLRRQGIARKLLNAAIEHIAAECKQACIEISAQSDEDSDISQNDLVNFYKSLNFEAHQKYAARTDLRLYLDISTKPTPVFDSPCYFKFSF